MRTVDIKPEDLQSVRALLPATVDVLGARVADYQSFLHTDEQCLVEKAVHKRRCEFSTGRFLAARALDKQGLAATPLLRGTANEPLWPDGINGSISHTDEVCVVAITSDNAIAGIGVDLEKSNARVSDLTSMILRPEEIDAVEELTQADKDRTVRISFSAKEAIYKAVYPLLQRFVDFSEVCISVSDNTFSARAPESAALDELLRSGVGRYCDIDSHVVTVFYLAA